MTEPLEAAQGAEATAGAFGGDKPRPEDDVVDAEIVDDEKPVDARGGSA